MDGQRSFKIYHIVTYLTRIGDCLALVSVPWRSMPEQRLAAQQGRVKPDYVVESPALGN